MSDESIYNLIPRPQEIPVRPTQFKSSFPGRVNPSEFEFGQNKLQGGATFGRPNGTNAEPPSQFTRAHSKEPILPAPAPPTTIKVQRKANIPAKDEPPIMGLSSNKNFISTNAVEVILSTAKNTPQQEFLWTNKICYGKVPVYLKRNKQQVTAERDAFETYMKMREQPSSNASVTELAPAERQELIRHLKRKWGSLNEAYQKLSLSPDSAIKIHRKEELERMLAEVEKDIKTLEHGEKVLIMQE